MIRRRKFYNIPTRGFASKKEADRARELQLLEKAGEITQLRRQVRFEVIPACGDERAASYFADFAYCELPSMNYIVEDCKSEPTRKLPAYILKRKLMNWLHNIQVREV